MITKALGGQDSSWVEKGRGAGTQTRSEIGPYRRDCAFPGIDRDCEAWPSGRARYLDEVPIKRDVGITVFSVLRWFKSGLYPGTQEGHNFAYHALAAWAGR